MAAVLKTWEAVKAELARHPEQTVLLLLGNGKGFDDIVKYADQAIHFPEAEAVVWYPNAPQGMSSEDVASHKPGDPEYVACSLSEPQNGARLVCAFVSRAVADPRGFVKAFAAAGKCKQPPVVIT